MHISIRNDYIASSSTILLYYIIHTSSSPSYKEVEHRLYVSKFNEAYNYYNWESSTITAAQSSYLSFILVQYIEYGYVSITISEPLSEPTTIGLGTIFLIVFFSILGIYTIILFVIGCIRNRKKGENEPKVESTPQPENYTPLTPPQNQQSQLSPYDQASHYMDPQHNINE